MPWTTRLYLYRDASSATFFTTPSQGFFALIGSAAFIALGWQLFKGEQALILPKQIRAVRLSLLMRGALVGTCLKVIGFFRQFTKARLSF